MKISSPKCVIPQDEPYKNDLFNRKSFGDALISLIAKSDECNVICIDAPWGEGKTTFAEMWIADLKLKGINAIYYNSYEHDFTEDPFLSFAAEINEYAKKHFAEIKNVEEKRNEFKQKAIAVSRKVLATTAKIGIKALTLGIIKDSDIDAVNSIRDDIANDSSTYLSKYIEDKFSNYNSEIESVIDFKNSLSELGKSIRDQQKVPLIIVIDELDRCRPNYALDLIERIKHLFTVSHVTFVILTNTKQLENYIKTIFGCEIDAYNYLHKFFNISTVLPIDVKRGDKRTHLEFLKSLVNHHGLSRQLNDYLNLLETLMVYYNLSLRQIEKCFIHMALYFSSLTDGNFMIVDITVLLSIIKIIKPNLFDKLKSSKITYNDFENEMQLSAIPANDFIRFNKDRFNLMLKYFLLSEQEYLPLASDITINNYQRYHTGYYSIERLSVIPILCNELIRFKEF